ncbi:MAG: hypothetical protein JWP74_141 [Marmoricola sp.]|nr:hypothetical protein [Marmoricola sp.]
MTTFDRSLSTTVLADVGRLLVIPTVAGLALSLGDLVTMTHVAYPWANLANSSAIWAIGAFVLGAALRTDPARSAVAGVVMMLVAVESYYGFAVLFDLGGLQSLWSNTAQTWLVFGVFAGVVFGIAGAWTSGTVWWQRVLGAAAGGGVLIGEALHTRMHLGLTLGGFRNELNESAVLMAVLGVALVVATSRSPKVLIPAMLLTVPTAMFCAAAFSAAGITY